ncbi:MAG: uroporphyrinogen decarboxylase family protein [Armatimonadota bacterium]
MTSRERLLTVLHRGVPDRVPVFPGYGTWYGSRIFGIDLFDIEEGRVSAGQIMADLAAKYGCETWYWVGYSDTVPLIRTDGQVEYQSIREEIDSDNYVAEFRMINSMGTLSQRLAFNRYNPAYEVAGFVQDPERDWPIYEACMGNTWEWGGTTSVSDVPEEHHDLGIVSFDIALPVDWWIGLRGDAGAGVMDLYDGTSTLSRAVEWYRRYSLAYLASRLEIEPAPDLVVLGGSSSSLSVISPPIYRRYNLDFINAVCALAHTKDVPVMVHHCGKSAKLVEIIAQETDLDIIHPLEPPPGGDVDLREIKRRFGDRLVFMGNLNTYQLMLYGTPKEVEEAARKCIEDAGEGGGFVLANGDQLGRNTPEENVMAMVEAAYKYGQY